MAGEQSIDVQSDRGRKGLQLAGWLVAAFGVVGLFVAWLLSHESLEYYFGQYSFPSSISQALKQGEVFSAAIIATPSVLSLVIGVVLLILGYRLPSADAVAERKRALAEHRDAQSIEERADEIRKWEQAYRLAHGGAEPPPGFVPPTTAQLVASNAGKTNTLAVLALVFGILGSVVGAILGHVALAQIKRTGDSGRGLAIAGIVLGYLTFAIYVALSVWYVIVVQSLY